MTVLHRRIVEDTNVGDEAGSREPGMEMRSVAEILVRKVPDNQQVMHNYYSLYLQLFRFEL